MRKYTQFKQLAKFNEGNGIDLELEILTKVVGLESLHHGLWAEGVPVTIENLKVAQNNYSKYIAEVIPDGVKTVLDVGGGIGDVAKLLSSRGFSVCTISPIKDHELRYSKTNKDNGNKFVLSTYEDFQSDFQYDLILMSESSNYIDLEKGMHQTKKYLKDNGYLLVFAIFSKNEDGLLNRYTKDRFVQSANSVGLDVCYEEDITKRTINTLVLAHSYYINFIPPLVDVLSNYYKSFFSLKTKILKMLFRKELRLLSTAIQEIVPLRIDPTYFEDNFTYEVILFKKVPVKV